MQDIAVIIPVYNGAEMLESCVQSVNTAGKRISKIIIVDDGSTDNTFSVAEKLADNDKRIKLIHTDNHGSYMARVTGIRAATTSYVAFIDVDDQYYPGALDLLADLLESHDADISFGGIVEISETRSIPKKIEKPLTYTKTPEQMWPRIMKWKTQEFMFYVWHKLYKRELFENLPEIDHICQGDDVLLTCKAFLGAEKIVETTSPVYLYYINPVGLTHRGFSDSDLDLIRVWDTVVEMMHQLPDYYAMEPKLAYLAQYNRWRTDFTLISRLVLAGDKISDLKYVKEVKKWQNGLNKHWKDLIKPHAMPRNRELLIIAFRFFFKPTKFLLRLGRKLKKMDTGVLLHSGDKTA